MPTVVQGQLLWKGYRAWGSMAGRSFLFTLFFCLFIYSLIFPSSLHNAAVIFPSLIIMLILFFSLFIGRLRWRFYVTDRQLAIRFGIIAAETKSYLYDQVQSVTAQQTVLQRLLLWGEIRVTILISGTGMAAPSIAYMPYVSRPQNVAAIVQSHVTVGERPN